MIFDDKLTKPKLISKTPIKGAVSCANIILNVKSSRIISNY